VAAPQDASALKPNFPSDTACIYIFSAGKFLLKNVLFIARALDEELSREKSIYLAEEIVFTFESSSSS